MNPLIEYLKLVSDAAMWAFGTTFLVAAGLLFFDRPRADEAANSEHRRAA